MRFLNMIFNNVVSERYTYSICNQSLTANVGDLLKIFNFAISYSILFIYFFLDRN